MLEVSTRSPTPDEQHYIKRQCKPDFASLGCMALTLGIFPGIALGLVGGWLGGFISPDVASWARYIGLIAGIIGLVYGSITYWPTERKRRQQAEADLADSVVEELSVKTKSVTELFCGGSHEPCLVFDVGDNQLLFLQGQWLRWDAKYGSPESVSDGNEDYFNLLEPPYSFPSDSFVVSRLPSSGYVFAIKVDGDYLGAAGPIDALKREFDFRDCEIIPGTMDSIPDSLEAEHQRRRGI